MKQRSSWKIEDLKNFGPVSTGWLHEAGFFTLHDIEEIGAVEVYRRVKAQQPRASLNLLYALQAAVLGIRWDELPLDMRDELRRAAEGG